MSSNSISAIHNAYTILFFISGVLPVGGYCLQKYGFSGYSCFLKKDFIGLLTHSNVFYQIYSEAVLIVSLTCFIRLFSVT